ncbi:uncharacterized protein LOC109704000 [Ananas comosus]|uniref:Uncharacterized protein LOC109704000 n=1 Tax=Ananas comosus TaxID=4615 RepID=A0A6P5EAN7_ANACO|nr:uncharacterized protein LOC109704000 [Ananas comosus]
MEKASSKELMSLEEWEFLDFGHDGRDLSQKIFFDPKGIINMDYFICPSHPTPPIPPHPAHVETHQDDGDGDAGGGGDGPPCKDIPVVVLPDQDPVSQVVFFFKKTRDAEFVDMKMGSPMAGAKLIVPHVEPDPILFDEEEGPYSSTEVAEDKASKKNSAELIKEEEEEEEEDGDSNMCSEDKKGNQLLEGIGFTVWRWRVNGIGALCSIGVAAAATICVFILGGKHKHQQQHQHQHQHQHQKHQQQKLQFQIYTEDKRIKQAVQQATRLNQAISAMRGAPITRAHISFGGYYDGL